MISASPTGPATLSMVIWPAAGDADQRVVDAPDRAQQADEGRRGADRGQQHLAELQLVAARRAARRAAPGSVAASGRRPLASVPAALAFCVAAISGSTSASRSKAATRCVALPRPSAIARRRPCCAPRRRWRGAAARPSTGSRPSWRPTSQAAAPSTSLVTAIALARAAPARPCRVTSGPARRTCRTGRCAARPGSAPRAGCLARRWRGWTICG